MSFKRTLGFSFVITLALWAWFSWPVPRYLTSRVPTAAHYEKADLQPMIPGDHLQFMYYCWLAGDMVAGKTPLFYNLYEFNTGNDRERFEPDAYYFPFSLIYAAAAGLGGRAFGWNLTGFISLWITYLLTWLLVRLWTRNEWVAAATALLGIALPFRWINLFGGSPAGFAMAWVPAILLGVDLAVREDRIGGGILAGAAIFLASWTDKHVFFFGTLAVPVWGAVAFAARSDFQWHQSASYRRIVWALLPIGLFATAAFLFPSLMKGLYRTVTGLAPVANAIGPRAFYEIAIYSPDWRGFFGISKLVNSHHVYLGLMLMAFLSAGWLTLAFRSISDRKTYGRTLVVFTFVMLGLLGIMILALGPRGLEHGLLFRIGRRLIPPYAMIRQPAKIFCLMPSFLAVASALTLTALISLRPQRLWPILILAGFTFLIPLNYAHWIHPTISRLEKKQDAYAAVADDAAAGNVVPRALVLPLWPGDSHYASIYQYFASLYHVRMVNGYNPFIKAGYFENVFRPFESLNQGGFSGDQMNALLQMNVRYIILHENLFPEKVSPFPVAATLKQLLSHPRLECLRQDGSVWAFKILDAPRTTTAAPPHWDILFPARRFEMEKMSAERQVTMKMSPEAGGRAYRTLEEPGAALKTAPIRVAAVSNLHWLVRTRGQGMLAGEVTIDQQTNALPPIPVRSPEWTWLNLPVPDFQGFATLRLKLALQSGGVDLDLSLLTAGPWPGMDQGESVTLPAPVFFHAGNTDLKSSGVIFRPAYDPHGIVFYGPKLPLPRGTYAVDIVFSSSAPPGTELAVVNLEQDEVTGEDVAVPLRAGQPAQGRWRQSENLPFNLVLVYSANADLEIRQVTFTRLK